jgi:hypothetical protein
MAQLDSLSTIGGFYNSINGTRKTFLTMLKRFPNLQISNTIIEYVEKQLPNDII